MKSNLEQTQLEVYNLNENIKECQKRESSLKDQLDTARQDKEKLGADLKAREFNQ